MGYIKSIVDEGSQLGSLSSKQPLQDTNSITEMDNSPIIDLNFSSEDGERKSSSETPQAHNGFAS